MKIQGQKAGLFIGIIIVLFFILVILQFNRYEIEKLNQRDGLLLDRLTGEVYLIDSYKKEKINYFSLTDHINKQDDLLKNLENIATKLDVKVKEIKRYRDESEQILNEVKSIKSSIIKRQSKNY